MNPEYLQTIHHALQQQNAALNKTNDLGIERKNFTTRIIRIISIFLAILLVVNLFIMFQLNRHLMSITEHIDTMKNTFHQVAGTIKVINNDVQYVSNIMLTMPKIESSMNGITYEIPSMALSINSITEDIGAVDHYLSQVNHKMYMVSHQMAKIGNSTQVMNQDMREIAHPTRFFNWMLPR